MKKAELVEMVLALQTEKQTLVDERKHMFGSLTDRIVALERSQFLYEQYGRRECIEISGIPTSVKDDDLEEEVLRIYQTAEVKVFGRDVCKEDISACHRLGKKKETTIVRFVNRKFAFAGLINSKNLKDSKLYDHNVYINNSFCREFAKFGYYIRQLKSKKKIVGYRVRHGIFQVQLEKEGDYFEISHETDFAQHGLCVDEFRK